MNWKLSVFYLFPGLAAWVASIHAEYRFAEEIHLCPALEPRHHGPKDISDLRPDDIGMVMALGDSVTAGFGAKAFSFLETKILQEYRGLSFCMGGDHQAPTIPNFLKHYRPDIIGSSMGTHLIELCMGGVFCAPDELAYRPRQDVFNAALSGAVSGTLALESRYLLGQVIRHQTANIISDWKLLTIFIGTNELCHSSCLDKEDGQAGTPSDFEQRIMLTIVKLRAKLPKLLINLLLLPDMSQIYSFTRHHFMRCVHAFKFLEGICPCATSRGEAGRWAMRKATAEYNNRLMRLAKNLNTRAIREAKRSGKPRDFGIVVAPVLRDTDLQNDMPAHFASLFDCFHPSATAHRSLALTIWYTKECDGDLISYLSCMI